jgi:hypothetical protein
MLRSSPRYRVAMRRRSSCRRSYFRPLILVQQNNGHARLCPPARVSRSRNILDASEVFQRTSKAAVRPSSSPWATARAAARCSWKSDAHGQHWHQARWLPGARSSSADPAGRPGT